MVAVAGKRLLRADSHRSRSADDEREGDGSKRQDFLHGRILSKGVPHEKPNTTADINTRNIFVLLVRSLGAQRATRSDAVW